MELFEQGKVKLYRGDCMELMAGMGDKSIDLAIVDPEYGIDIANRSGSIGQRKGQGVITTYTKKNWDKKPPSQEYFTELFRVSKNQVIWGGNYFTNFLPPSMGWIVWDKRQPDGVTFAQAELAFTSFHRSVKKFSCSRAFIGNKVANNKHKAAAFTKVHPAQKPILLYSWIMELYATPDMKILDTHLGSGSSAIAAHYFGCEFTGIEIDPDYYEAAVKRFKENTKQQTLFAA